MGYEGKYTHEGSGEGVRAGKKGGVCAHRAGEAQEDFGYALAKISGELRKVGFFVMVLPHSNAFFVMGFEWECTENIFPTLPLGPCTSSFRARLVQRWCPFANPLINSFLVEPPNPSNADRGDPAFSSVLADGDFMELEVLGDFFCGHDLRHLV